MTARKIDTPWKPYIHPLPKIPRTNLAFTRGRAYDAINDPYPTYQSFRPEFFAGDSNHVVNTKSGTSSTDSRSVRGFLGISKKTGSSRGSGLRNIIFSERTTSRQQGLPTSQAPASSKGRSALGIQNTRGGSGRARKPIKSDSGLFRDAKRWVKRLWMPKAKPLVGARVDLLD